VELEGTLRVDTAEHGAVKLLNTVVVVPGSRLVTTDRDADAWAVQGMETTRVAVALSRSVLVTTAADEQLAALSLIVEVWLEPGCVTYIVVGTSLVTVLPVPLFQIVVGTWSVTVVTIVDPCAVQLAVSFRYTVVGI